MFFIILFFPFAFSENNIPPTKNIFGGIFGWADALSPQRKMWEKSTIIPSITFYPGEPNFNPIMDHIIQEVFSEINLTAEINKIADIFPTEDEQTSNSGLKSLYSKQYGNFSVKNQKTSIKLLEEFKNIELLDFHQYDEIGYTAEQFDELIGQLFTVVGVISLIAAFFAISFVFFLLFCFGCCCCCKTKAHTNPGAVAIVFFVIAFLLMILGSIFQLVSVYGIYHIWNFAVNDMSSTSSAIIDSLKQSIEALYDPISTQIGGPVRSLINTITVLRTNIQRDSNAVINSANLAVNKLGNEVYPTYRDQISTHARNFSTIVQNINDRINNQGQCSNVPTGGEIISSENLDKAEEYQAALTQINESIQEVNDLVNFPIETIDQLIDLINDFLPYLENTRDYVHVEEDLNDLKSTMNDIGESISEIKSFDINNFNFNTDLFIKIVCIIPGLLMLITALCFAAAFFTHCCCSRCIASCASCQPFVCNIVLFIIGSISSVFIVYAVIIMNDVVDSGDYFVNKLIDQILVDRKIQIPDVNLQSITRGIISTVSFEPIYIPNDLNVIKHFLEGNPDESIVSLLSLRDWLPLNEFGNIINNTFTNVSQTADLSVFSNYANEMKQQVSQNIPSSFDALFGDEYNFANSLEQARINVQQLQAYRDQNPNSNECVATQEEIDQLNELLDLIEFGYNETVVLFNEAHDMVQSDVLGGVDTLVITFDSSFRQMFSSTGSEFKTAVSNIYSVLDVFKSESLVGTVNIFRTELIYYASLTVVLISIAAHLYLVGQFVMVINLCIRRRGMGSKVDISLSSYTYSSSEFNSSDSSYSDKPRKRRRRRDYPDDDGFKDIYHPDFL